MRTIFEVYRELRARGVLGINQRNGRYVLPLNPRSCYPRVDNKVITKRLAETAGIPTPGLLGVISHHHELRNLLDRLDALKDFVLKPARGAQGNGILVIIGVKNSQHWRSTRGDVSLPQMRQHVSSTISGVFSLGGDWDSCLIEARVILHPDFERISTSGIPDVRLIVYRGFPVMAMCRLPTVRSGGRANLHQGAIGAGADIATGCLTHAAYHNRSIRRHVDTDGAIVGFQIPMWEEVLALGVRAADMSGLGYVGVDVVVDAQRGPLLLELNARPGLGIQIANGAGLLSQLRQAESLSREEKPTWQERCHIARELFAQ